MMLSDNSFVETNKIELPEENSFVGTNKLPQVHFAIGADFSHCCLYEYWFYKEAIFDYKSQTRLNKG